MMQRLLAAWVAAWTCCGAARADDSATAPASCAAAADACYFTLPLPGGALHFYASQDPAQPTAAPTRALVAIHGHSHDANKTFDAGLRAVRGAAQQAGSDTLTVAPVFQVDGTGSARCSTRGVPSAAAGDLVWSCSSWQEGAAAHGTGTTAFAALDALLAHLQQRWPSLRTVTVAGFSAGAQMVQRYAAFAAPAGNRLTVRYVVADPGNWLYFDSFRPFPPGEDCPRLNHWKYGTKGLPVQLGRNAAQARAAYAAADIHYLQGALDNSSGPGTAARVLDTSCAAMAQGPFRLQRGLAYADYDRRLLAPDRNRQVTVVPGCAHDVACVFPAPAARAALLGLP